ncbi:MAG: nucleotide exchange factor GrpE [Cyclobacteriaceae bacterium]
MSKDNIEEKDLEKESVSVEETDTQEQEMSVEEEEQSVEEEQVDELTAAKNEVAEAKDKYIRLYSEFENFRRRTSKEKLDLIQTANKDLMGDLIPVLDDFERAMQSITEKLDIEAAKEGIDLIYNKFKKTLDNKGLKKMDIEKGADFNDDFHEAITQIPAGEEMAGKIVDVVENGYFLGDKVVRFAKVVTGAKS